MNWRIITAGGGRRRPSDTRHNERNSYRASMAGCALLPPGGMCRASRTSLIGGLRGGEELGGVGRGGGGGGAGRGERGGADQRAGPR